MTDPKDMIWRYPPKAMGYWVISGEDLIQALHRVAAGEDPDMLYTELYANANIENVEGK